MLKDYLFDILHERFDEIETLNNIFSKVSDIVTDTWFCSVKSRIISSEKTFKSKDTLSREILEESDFWLCDCLKTFSKSNITNYFQLTRLSVECWIF